DKGIECLQKATALNKHSAAAWNGLGFAYNQKKKYYKAIECCRRAAGINPKYANAWNNLGYACAKVGRNEDSWTAYRNAVKMAPKVELYKKNFLIANERMDSFKSL
ncbi:MAG: tetratricopeptide repeat protein, partial [Selenomonadaceae bacterium]|nr:tetratricopeptide repeat protein [Selenomonadaceae bacterium]